MNYKTKYLAFVLDEKSRNKLLKAFPPQFEKVICHHVTIQFNGVDEDTFNKFKGMTRAMVVGAISDDSLEALVVQFGGTTDREDGSTYHITLSLDSTKRKPVDSNTLLKSTAWTKCPNVAITGEVKLENK